MLNSEYSTRVAGPGDVDLIWTLYQETGFLYPEKLAAMGDGGRGAHDTLGRLLCSPAHSFRVVLAFGPQGDARAACTFGRVSGAEAWIMHMVSQHDRCALMHAIVGAFNEAVAAGPSWFVYTFRENNTSVARLFNHPCQNGFVSAPIENAVYDFFAVEPAAGAALARLGGNLPVRQATARDRDSLAGRLAESSARVSLEASGDWTRVYPAHGRERVAMACGSSILVADIAPPYWNLSNLSTGVRFWQAKDDTAEAAALLSAVARWFAGRKADRWTVLAAPGAVSLRAVLSRAGLTSRRRYQRISAPASVARPLIAYYARFIGRSLPLPEIRKAA